jgi:hypothetical protein
MGWRDKDQADLVAFGFADRPRLSGRAIACGEATCSNPLKGGVVERSEGGWGQRTAWSCARR